MSDVILEARGLTKRFRSREEGRRYFTAVDGASLSLHPGETLGLLGESGSGKSTLGQMLVGLIRPDEGSVLYRGETLPFPFRGLPRQKASGSIRSIWSVGPALSPGASCSGPPWPGSW